MRRWLGLLHKPNRLDSPEIRALLRAHGRTPRDGTPLEIGRAAVRLLTSAIDDLAPGPDAPAAERLPHAVLRICFVEGAKAYQAAGRLGLSERQLTRERGHAISLLTAHLAAGPARPAFVPEEIPTIESYVERPALMLRTESALERARSVWLHGPAGIGKTTLAAELAMREKRERTVWWHHFRRGVNDSFVAVMFELSEWLASQGIAELGRYVGKNLASLDAQLAARVAIRSLSDVSALIVLDNFQTVEGNVAISGFFDEVLARVPDARVAVVSRRAFESPLARVRIEVPAFSRGESDQLLLRLGIRRPASTLARVHSWTGGNPQLIKLAGSWLRTATPEEVATGFESLGGQEEVQAFLLSNLTELLDSDDRYILDAASVFRDRFSDDALAYVTERTRGAVAATAQRLVRGHAATRSRQGSAVFLHGSVRDYVYERLDPERRAALHLRAAAWYHRNGNDKEAGYHRARAGLDESDPPI